MKSVRRALGMAGLASVLLACNTSRHRPPPGSSRSSADAAIADAPAAIDADASARAPEPVVLSPIPPTTLEQQRAVGEALGRFGLELLGRANPAGNAILSPLDLGAALWMLEVGASGATAQQLRDALHTEPLAMREEALAGLRRALRTAGNGPGGVLTSAVRVWTARGITLLPEYLALTRDRFDATAVPLDIAGDPGSARGLINRWVSDQTRGHVPALLDTLTSDTRVMLTTAAYFLGRWAAPFDEGETRDGVFWTSANTGKTIRMMHGRVTAPLLEGDGTQLLELPYQSGAIELDLVMPARGTSLDALGGRLTAAQFADWTARAERNVTPVAVALPRCSLRARSRLRDDLTALGVRDAFSPTADFSRMTNASHVEVAEVIHEVTLEFRETGTEATAATAIGGYGSGGAMPAFVVDRPFFFAIRHRPTATLLFVGRVRDIDPAAPTRALGRGEDPDAPGDYDPLHPPPSRGLTNDAGTAPLVRALPPRVTGARSSESVRQVVLGNLGAVTHCFEMALARNANIAGSASVHFVIGRAGDVTLAEEAPRADDVPSVTGCVVRAARGWRFAPPAPGTADVVYSFALTGPQ